MIKQNDDTKNLAQKSGAQSTCRMAALAAWMLFPACALAQTTINFEEHPVDTRVSNQYSNHGVLFLNDYSPGGQFRASPIIKGHTNAPSTRHVLVNDQRDCEIFSSRNRPLSIQFDNPMTHVGMAVGTISNLPGDCSGCSTETATITFHGCGGNVLAVRSANVSTAFDTRVDYYDIRGRIMGVDIDFGDTNCPEAIDDLTFRPSPLGCLFPVTPCPPLVVGLSDDAPGEVSPVLQTFNETRGLDVTVLSSTQVPVRSMSLDDLSIGSASSALVGARIYDGNTSSLVASADVTVNASGPVTVPISADLAPGGDYRLCFYVETTPPFQGSGPLVFSFPFGAYTESNGIFRINSAHAIGADAFPTNMNYGVPPISIGVEQTGCLPQLVVAAMDGMFLLSWEDDGDRFELQESSNLASWIASERELVIDGHSHTVAFPISGTDEEKHFFRLVMRAK